MENIKKAQRAYLEASDEKFKAKVAFVAAKTYYEALTTLAGNYDQGKSPKKLDEAYEAYRDSKEKLDAAEKKFNDTFAAYKDVTRGMHTDEEYDAINKSYAEEMIKFLSE